MGTQIWCGGKGNHHWEVTCDGRGGSVKGIRRGRGLGLHPPKAPNISRDSQKLTLAKHLPPLTFSPLPPLSEGGSAVFLGALRLF